MGIYATATIGRWMVSKILKLGYPEPGTGKRVQLNLHLVASSPFHWSSLPCGLDVSVPSINHQQGAKHMSFVNERISPEDFHKYDIGGVFKKVLGPYAPARTANARLGWTIDRSRDIFLLYITCRGRSGDGPDVETYVLWWSGALIKFDLETMPGSLCDRTSEHLIMELRELNIPKDFAFDRQHVLAVLKEARLCHANYEVFGMKKNCTIDFRF